ncbi:MAG: hypothetical protein ACSHYA_18760, partial [Opitutaceae bacterium]
VVSIPPKVTDKSVCLTKDERRRTGAPPVVSIPPKVTDKSVCLTKDERRRTGAPACCFDPAESDRQECLPYEGRAP